MCRGSRCAFGVLSPKIVLQKAQNLQEGKFGRLTGTDLADIVAFVAISGFKKWLNMGDCVDEIQVPFYLAATAAHGDLPGFQTVLSTPNPWLSVAASSEDSYPKPELEHMPQGTACIIQGHIFLKQTFKSKPGF